jgi:hypothetical protein
MAERAEMIAILLDCALYLFERLKNLFAFGYFMEALNSEHVIDSTFSFVYYYFTVVVLFLSIRFHLSLKDHTIDSNLGALEIEEFTQGKSL